jgi:hypothetical protein
VPPFWPRIGGVGLGELAENDLAAVCSKRPALVYQRLHELCAPFGFDDMDLFHTRTFSGIAITSAMTVPSAASGSGLSAPYRFWEIVDHECAVISGMEAGGQFVRT